MFKNKTIYSVAAVGFLILMALQLTSPNLRAQNRAGTGECSVTVVDESGIPLPGAAVMLKGTTVGQATDTDGRCSFQALPKDAVLLVSCIGFNDVEVNVAGRREIKVSLGSAASYLDEVVVVGYGTMRRKDLSGSVAQISGDEVQQYSTFSTRGALQGRIAGVQVNTSSGAPGGTVQIRIRGTNSLKGDNEPLYIIDGFPGDINMINTSDVESIEVLKDASATAIYGSRGANGVIVVTTLRPKEGSLKVTYDGSVGVQSVAKKFEMLNAQEYMDFYNLYAQVNSFPVAYTEEEMANNKYDTDWLKECTHPAVITNHSVNVSGGTKRVQANAGVSYFDQDGIVRYSGIKRFVMRSSVNYNFSKAVSANARIIYSRVGQNSMNSTGVNSVSEHIFVASPLANPYGETTKWNNMSGERSGSNPLAYISEISNKYEANRVQADAGVVFRPIDGLSVSLSAAIHTNDNRTDYFKSLDYPGSTGEASISLANINRFVSNNIIQYDKVFGKHSLSAMTGVTYEERTGRSTSTGSATGFISNVVETYSIQSADNKGLPSSSYNKWNLFSVLARLNYSYDNRYLVTMNFRSDGSSRYSPGNKWGYFPSFAVAWRASQESFLRSVSWLDELKVRASWGQTGSTAIDPYATIDDLVTYLAVINKATVTGYAPSDKYLANLKWETTEQTDFGVDFAAFNNRLRLTADYYYKKTTDLLNDVEMPRSSGFTKSLQNIGVLQNQGFEFAVDGRIVDRAFKWDLGVNASINRSKVLSLAAGADIFGDTINCTLFNGQLNLVREGEPLFVFYGYREDGYDETGNIVYKDLDESGSVTALDREIIGDPNPDFTLNINTTLRYKRVSLNALITGVFGNDLFSIPAANLYFFYTEGKNVTKDMYENHWTAENPDAKYPNVLKTLNLKMSDRYVYDASYIKLKNIELGYDIPCGSKSTISKAHVYISGQNLLYFTKYPFSDPDVNYYGGSSSFRQGVDYMAYPTAKSVTMGCRITF